MKRRTLTVFIAFAAILFLVCSVSAESADPWAGIEPVYTGEVRGGRFVAVTYCVGDAEYNGILDLRGGYAVAPSSACAVAEGQGEDEDDIQYYGGRDTGVYWIDDAASDTVAFLEVPSGYFSGFRFDVSQDPWFADPETDFLRVTEDGETFAYINRRNGEYLTDFLFQQMNLTGFVGPFAVEKLADSGAWVVVNCYGILTPLPAGCEPVDWYDGIEDDLRSGRILLQREDGSTFFCEVELSLDPDVSFDYDTRESEVSGEREDEEEWEDDEDWEDEEWEDEWE